jgi:hypothetical protein
MTSGSFQTYGNQFGNQQPEEETER